MANTRQDRTKQQKEERVFVDIPETIKRRFKGSKRYKKENWSKTKKYRMGL